MRLVSSIAAACDLAAFCAAGLRRAAGCDMVAGHAPMFVTLAPVFCLFILDGWHRSLNLGVVIPRMLFFSLITRTFDLVR